MSKRAVLNKSSDPQAKKFGRCSGNLVWCEEIGRKTTPKIMNAIKNNKKS